MELKALLRKIERISIGIENLDKLKSGNKKEKFSSIEANNFSSIEANNLDNKKTNKCTNANRAFQDIRRRIKDGDGITPIKKGFAQMIEIHIPIKVEKNVQNQIKNSYSKAIDTVGYDEQVYVFKKIDNILKRFLNSKVEWKYQLGYFSRFLKLIYKDYFEYIHAECPGWFDLGDLECLDCGENRSAIYQYQRCKQRRHRWSQLGKGYLEKERIDEVQSSILAALFYLCNPYDVIPDFTPGTGFVDDAFVINLALKVLFRRYRKLFNKHSNMLGIE
jgi:uncharacterized membrane protein YkvA (DUF1232 family)